MLFRSRSIAPVATAGPSRRLPLLKIALVAGAFVAGFLSGCCQLPAKWKHQYDEPMSYEGRERICLYNCERILDAKQEWSLETGAGVGSLSPSVEVLAHTYFRRYEYGRRIPCDDDTQNLPVTVPRCPSGGEYVIGTVGERPKCTKHGDLLRDYDLKVRVKHTH